MPEPAPMAAGDPQEPRDLEVVRVAESDRLEAAQQLVRGPGREGEAAARRFLDAARLHGIDLTHLFAARDAGGRVRQAVLAVPGAGRTATFFTSPVDSEREASELGRALEHACSSLEGVALAQTLVEPEKALVIRAFERGGFTRLTDLTYLERDLSGSAEDPGEPDAGVRVRRHAEAGDEPFLRGLEASYAETLDCPELCRMRRVEDALESHKATGSFDPRYWFVVEDGSGAAGAMLLNRCPEQLPGAVELVYIGLAPRLRGRGLASWMLRRAFFALRAVPERRLTCAVDERNAPAMRLYERFGFSRFSRRCALVRPLGACAVDSGAEPG